MLRLLQIENIAIIEKAEVSFSPGLNILTGETGAGKSILIDSINAVSGAKTSRDLIRSGESSAAVTASFDRIDAAALRILEELGVPAEEDGSLVIVRKLYRDGRNVCFINGMSVTLSMIRRVAMHLITIHGQRDSQTLLDQDSHIDVLDGYCRHGALLSDYQAAFRRLREIEREIKKLQMDEAYKARRIDLLTYQIAELEQAQLTEGETEQLRHRRAFLRNAMKVRSALQAALYALIGGEESAGAEALLRDAEREILSVTDVAKNLNVVAEQVEAAYDTVSDAAAMLDDVLSQLADGESDLDAIEERLDLLYRLGKKYGPTEAEMLAFLREAQEELGSITGAEERIAALAAERETVLLQTRTLADRLHAARAEGGAALAEAVKNELRFLDMPNVEFITRVDAAELGEKGADSVAFYISANVGEAPKPLGKVASGGELSRIMLAIRNVLNAEEGASTLIFDEIDQGVSGSAAGKIARKLSAVSRNTQVLCITHSAQIAAFADSHRRLSKSVRDGKTYTEITPLSDEARARELARINFGNAPSETQIASAMQMIELAKAEKQKC